MVLLGMVTLIGYYAGQIIRKMRLPSLLGYMLLGVFVGSPDMGIFNEHDLGVLTFISELTLGFVAFMIGAELNLKSLKRQGLGIITVILSESFMAFFVVLTFIYLLTRDLPMALIFGAMAPASAPAGTLAVIQENNAKGSLTQALYAVVGFDDGLAILIFGFALAIAKSLLSMEVPGTSPDMLASLKTPIIEITMSFLIGGVFGVLFSFLARNVVSDRDYFLLVFGFILITTGLSNKWPISLILTNMVVGFVFANTRKMSLVQKVVRQLQPSITFFFILFFFLAGAHLKLKALPALGFIGLVYIIGRSAGLIGGAYLGAVMGKLEDKIKKYLGIGILSQAGVAIGLSLIVSNEFSYIGSEHADLIGTSVITTITATSIVFEIIGPILTKIGLEKAGEIDKGD
jgi:Kef-type K+ transport system membrane component KefB